MVNYFKLVFDVEWLIVGGVRRRLLVVCCGRCVVDGSIEHSGGDVVMVAVEVWVYSGGST